jgi:hypothetical protein
MIISIELSEDDWRFISEALGMLAVESDGSAEECLNNESAYDFHIENSCTAARLDGYISTAVSNAMARMRPKFSEN